MTTHTCQCGAAFTADPAGRLRHQMLHGHRPTTPAARDIWAEALKAEKGGAA
ncbi:hypothetical protein [Oerskovia rustica]|uniref:C2H2-type domain-containing protein n=1 Tax=Oerskovia rustica TaxID=2762237 RepID=A0ABR8RPA0_9CELL|nr:hypothetical protein [Oerskovia rustica]MBD7949616.1 hypothetical protein [Oerskovia rustica]